MARNTTPRSTRGFFVSSMLNLADLNGGGVG